MRSVALLAIVFSSACVAPAPATLSFSGSSVGREGEVIRLQLQRFQQAHPTLAVVLRATPDAADQRHQLYVQWLNARSAIPTSFSSMSCGRRSSRRPDGLPASTDFTRHGQFFPAALTADRWNGALYSLPWFVDVGMLYWRTDLVPHAPRDLARSRRSWREQRSAPSTRCRSGSSGRAPATKGS